MHAIAVLKLNKFKWRISFRMIWKRIAMFDVNNFMQAILLNIVKRFVRK